MKERPILFSGEMVKALLAGTKTQTRRICKPAMIHDGPAASVHRDGAGRGWIAWWPDAVSAEDTKRLYPGDSGFLCPYGTPSDRMWVKETWQMPCGLDVFSPNAAAAKCVDAGLKPWAPVRYAADETATNPHLLRDFGGKWGKTRVSIHMPRWASRITLEVTGVRVERLQDISEEDAIVEGIVAQYLSADGFDRTDGYGNTPRYLYRLLWERINGEGSWAANPWVWALSFKRVGAE
jgi:hypothetical protein